MAQKLKVCLRSDSAFLTFLVCTTSPFILALFLNTRFVKTIIVSYLCLLFCFLYPEDSRKRYAHAVHLFSALRNWWGVHSAHQVDLSAPISSLWYRPWCASAGALQVSSPWWSRIWSWTWWWSRCRLKLMIALSFNLIFQCLRRCRYKLSQ